jgi:hypothetical protein
MGLRYLPGQDAPSGNFFKKISWDKIGNMPPWRGDPAPKILYAKYGWETGPSDADFCPSVRAPCLTPWANPNRRFLVPMVAVSPLNRTGKIAVQTILEISAVFLVHHFGSVLAWGP